MSDDRKDVDALSDAAEERLLRRLLEEGETHPDDSGVDPRVARETIETLGLLPWELEPVAPRPEIKEALMARLGAGGESSAAARLAALERRSRWMLPIAAVLALALVGLTGWQARQLAEQRRTIQELSGRLAAAAENGGPAAEARRQLAELSDHLAMVTSPGAEFCLLKPVAGATRLAEARATMVFSPDRKRWYLAARGIGPCERGKVYQLWFHTEDDAVRAATFHGRSAGERLELHGGADRRIQIRAVSITVESDPETTSPSEAVLFADQAMRLL